MLNLGIPALISKDTLCYFLCMNRRTLIKFGTWHGVTLGFSFPFKALADTSIKANPNSLIQALIDIGSPASTVLAKRLEQHLQVSNSYDLHLRNGSLGPADVEMLASGLESAHLDENLSLHSFSLSFNPEIGLVGTQAILRALPHHVIEIGLVGCNLGDQSVPALISFFKKSTRLKMVCIEDNQFSRSSKVELKNALSHLPGCVFIA